MSGRMWVLLILVIFSWAPTESQVVSTAQGRLKGEVREGYVSYTGVPYASVAAPDGRFKRAGLAPLWQGVREARSVQCSETSSAEQCLLLDIHVPSGAGPWPVLAWAAAGGPYHPRQLVREGIIVVVVYYRMGPQGFLCLGEEKIPGNAGVKDVVLALRWIRDNIVAFKGNPAKVVMAGQSFGATVVEAIMLSPMAAGLYHGAIIQSGTVLAPWAFNYDAKVRATKLGEMLSDVDSIATALLQSNIEELVDKSNKFDMSYFSFGICKESAIRHEEKLFSDAPFELLSSKKVAKVPIIIGYNTDEAYIFTSILKESRVTKTMTEKMAFLLPEELKFLNDREMNQAARQIEDMYFKSNKSLRAVLDYHRDAYFVSHIHRSAHLHTLSSHPVYYYQFSYSGDRGVQEESGVQKQGAAHSDELAYLMSGSQLNDDQGMVQRHFVNLWTSFVKNLNPTFKESIRWDVMDAEQPRVLDIGTELNMLDYPYSRTSAMWNDIYQKYYYSRNK